MLPEIDVRGRDRESHIILVGERTCLGVEKAADVNDAENCRERGLACADKASIYAITQISQIVPDDFAPGIPI